MKKNEKKTNYKKEGKKNIFVIVVIVVIIIVVGLVLVFSNLKDGKIYKVGKDIEAGEYILVGNSTYKIGDVSDKNFGYYAICNKKECNVENGDVEISNKFIDKAYVIVKDGQFLKVKHAKLYNAKEYKSTVENSISYSSNYSFSTYYKIGYDLSAGTYTLDGDDFYYSICTKPSCKISIDENEIIDNNNVKGSSTITVKDGQYLIIAGNGKVTATK